MSHLFLRTTGLRRVAILSCSVILLNFVLLHAALAKNPNQKLTEAAKAVFFEKEVYPILKANCFKCHGNEKKIRGDLWMLSRNGILTGGDTGEVVSLKKPAESLLVDAINYEDGEMPPTGKMKADKIAILTKWVELGIPWSSKIPQKQRPTEENIVDKKAKSFWAFQPVKRPKLPIVKNKKWVRNPIDTFILHRLEKHNLQPTVPANKIALIRRAYYDLIGLPPTPKEVAEFLADKSPQAFEKVVERLLKSPHYGERWGRHWLDLVRYAETNSFERDGNKPFVWRYRDYVIRALNNNKPYDQFVREQLAGDEFKKVTADSITATGYFRLGSWDDEPTDRLQARYDELDDIVTTTGQVFLGLTVNCARCHDHKLDPIPQSDYYKMLGFFHGVHPYGVGRGAATKFITATIPGTKNQKCLCVGEKGSKVPPTYILIRGNAHSKGKQVHPGFLSVLNTPDPELIKPNKNSKSSGRRTVFANWLTKSSNPMTSRVMVNRIWQHHFGRGIVRSPNNFGKNGSRPTHPQLLDWLASEFVKRGWRLKEMHRLIMASNAYQMSSAASSTGLKAGIKEDPENQLFWRFDMRRLSAEEIRDSILAVNGQLNRKMGGPSIYPIIPREVLQSQSRPGAGWGKSSPEERNRRSVYIFVKRSLLTPLLSSFDLADTDTTCPVRFTTTQPTQALTMLNSNFIQRKAKVFAQRLKKEAGPQPRSQVTLAFRLACGRKPSDQEIQRGIEFMKKQIKDGDTADLALQRFCLIILNLNEFVYVD